ncbi:MAG: hypothetical protein CFK52_03460 [Chloracidobacterium sp. CP2_5A]|nr:MAG: hypothetical protein CFK52_03460 [Chloracidobacterium sp. CP2_5A]
MAFGPRSNLESLVRAAPRRWRQRAALGLLPLALTAACAREPFRVRPTADYPVPETQAVAVAEADYAARARVLRDGNELVDRFDANHLTAGMLPVYVWLDCRSTAIDLKSARFRLRDASGQAWRRLSGRQSEKRLMKSYGIRAYSVDGYRTFRARYDESLFPAAGARGPGERADGFLFFEIPRARRDQPIGDMSLEIELRLAGKRRVTRIELPASDMITSPAAERAQE